MTGHFQEALNALSGVPAAERNGRWYYLAAMANAGIGNIIQAREQAEQACRMSRPRISWLRRCFSSS